MSLFGGGDESGPPSPSQASDFSISTIGEDQGLAAHSEGSPDTAAGHEDYNDHDDAGDEAEKVVEEPQDQEDNRSPSAISDTSDVEVRPNRFRGSDRAWLHHTHDDRSLAASLDQLKAHDLSLHLYSAHHLKARLRQQEAPSLHKPWSRKSRWIPTNQDIQKPWYPESDWTAWPLPPDVAPNGLETFGRPNDGLDAYTLRSADRPTPADNLREQLHAVILKRAHDDWKYHNQKPSQQLHITAAPVAAPARHSPPRRGRTRSISAGPNSVPSSPSVGDDLAPLSSLDPSVVEQGEQGHAESHPNHDLKEEAENVKDNHFARPCFSADDDRSHALLHPTVNHVMSKLDRLLLALHQSRQTHVHRARDGDTSDSSARSNSRSRSTSKRPSTKASNKRSNRPSESQAVTRIRPSRRIGSASRPSSPLDLVVFDDSGEDETYEPETPKRRSRSPSNRASSAEPDIQTTSPSGKKRRNPPKPGLRDWSEVLAMAGLTGWDPATIERARHRCRDLFGEDMQLYTMPEHDDSSADEAEPVSHAPLSRSAQTASWRCPFVNCFRNMQPLEQGFRWREHMRKAHKYDNDQIAKLEEQLVQSGDIAPVSKRHHVLAHNPRGWQPPDPLKCPHCPASEHVFPKVSRLLDHIRRGHKYDPRIRDPPERLLSKAAGQDEEDTSDNLNSSDEDSDGYMVGGVHTDGFLQPVLRHVGSRGKDLEQRAKELTLVAQKLNWPNQKECKETATRGRRRIDQLGESNAGLAPLMSIRDVQYTPHHSGEGNCVWR
ncbi:unnamed protein product [Aureobasidium uvarum]|uniref:Rrn9 domain-containing protein n=1 Tax=Aureobasidium uvarum TaxID=2773716 RepID=A0A9N8PRY0_9PEZI|nr:unnamed protein product [Aureobasidium uvarum]